MDNTGVSQSSAGRISAGLGRGVGFAPALFLLFVAVVINYVDRGNLSIAAPLLKEEWHLNASVLGALFSAFFWTYTAMQFVGGWLIDRFDPCRLLALGYLIWSVATAVTGLSTGFAMLLSLRLLLGIGESVIFPTVSKILARYLPEEKRGFANGVVGSGMRCGAVVRELWRRDADGEVWLASGVSRHRVAEPAVATCLVAMEAARRTD